MTKNKFLTILLLLTSFCFQGALAGSKNAVDKNDALDNFFGSTKSSQIKDPYENINRKIFSFNEGVDKYFLEPVALGYRSAVPKTPRKMIRNFLTNISLPVSAVNSLIQGKVDNSLATTSTFLINSTIGVVGLFDVAGSKNIKYKKEDFGQTLGHYKVDYGAFIIVPFLGPSTVRDFGGFIVDKAVDPLEINALEIGGKTDLISDDLMISINAIDVIDTRESVQDILSATRKESFDLYSTMRSAYLQNRQAKINN